MAKKTAPLLPGTEKLLAEFGARLKLARLRRRLTAKQVAERSGMSPMTLRSLESGGSGVTMGAYLSVMQVLGIERDLALLAAEDELGRRIQDSRLVGAGVLKQALPKASRKTAGGQAMASGGNELRDDSCVDPENASARPSATTSASLVSLLKPSARKRDKGKKE
ncbi:helix-turn-helix domain-containing protein [Stenotrophomonas sp. SI-NJAU-1]|uniref:helix-turn-helix domain-containing protein n=1 Tax=Stenotrophomonas TaxID=40323 RepID=UPI000E3E74C6|nr:MULTISPECIES: helix-turn-helix domain-containing protein [Stenotrophomonas]MBO1746381.1 helix-turn-helix domain-containing protein [Stenotrophomonas indicatrix]UEX18170.1 helix-turn-helix domain-containing protein [Stenotrophomonas sp. SI-NJAU-1]